MKFDSKLRPEDIASTDETRQHLTSVYFDKEAQRLVATNGHMLISVPCEAEPSDVSGLVPVRAIKGARRRNDFKTGKARVRLSRKLADDGAALHRRTDAQFPPWKQVIPAFKRGDKGTVTFAVNPSYLLALLKASAGSGTTGLLTITLNVTKEMGDPIRVVNEYGNRECEMIVMPGRV